MKWERKKGELSGTQERKKWFCLGMSAYWNLTKLSTKVTLSRNRAQGVKAVAIFGMFQMVFDIGRPV